MLERPLLTRLEQINACGEDALDRVRQLDRHELVGCFPALAPEDDPAAVESPDRTSRKPAPSDRRQAAGPRRGRPSRAPGLLGVIARSIEVLSSRRAVKSSLSSDGRDAGTTLTRR
jgi:hypothetical protein